MTFPLLPSASNGCTQLLTLQYQAPEIERKGIAICFYSKLCASMLIQYMRYIQHSQTCEIYRPLLKENILTYSHCDLIMFVLVLHKHILMWSKCLSVQHSSSYKIIQICKLRANKLQTSKTQVITLTYLTDVLFC